MADAKNEESKKYNLSPYILDSLSKEMDEAVNIVPEVNFVGFSMYTLLLAEVCREFSVILPQNETATTAFGYIDSACSILMGLGQIMQAKSAPIANRVKGVTNILAGAELYWLMILGFGPIGFAVDVGVGFLHSLYDMGKTLRRINDFDYWLHDTENELNYLESEKLNLIASIRDLKQQNKLEQGERKKKVLTWLIDRREKQLQETCFMINSLNNVVLNDEHGLERLEKLQQELLNNSYNALMLGAAFTGLVLLSFVGAGLPAVVLITVAVVLYTYKYAPRVGAFFEDVASYLNADSRDDTSVDKENPIIHL